MSINAWWCHALNNFGDAITPYIIQKITGEAAKAAQDRPHYMICGSIVRETNARSIVMGAGLGSPEQRGHPKADYVFVRGPLTAYHLNKQGIRADFITDPGIILPMLYNPPVERLYEMGVVPHYADYNRVTVSEGVLKINLTSGVESVIDDIKKCGLILSSSLHGIVAAHAYGIPAVWVEFSDKVVGGGFKFRDYFQSLGMTAPQPLDLRGGVVPTEVANKHIRYRNVSKLAKVIYGIIEKRLRADTRI